MLESAPAPRTPSVLPGSREHGHVLLAPCEPSGHVALLYGLIFIMVTTLELQSRLLRERPEHS